MFTPARCLGAIVVAMASAAAAQPSLTWHCVQESDEYAHVRCAPHAEPAAREASAAPLLPRRAGSADLRPVAHRGTETIFAHEVWRVPLFSQPTDVEHVQLLLKSVLCGRHPACAVLYPVVDTTEASQPPRP